METKTVSTINDRIPTLFNDFFKPWNEWFDDRDIWNRPMNIPAINITEHPNEFLVSLAAPGLKKSDFKLNIEGNLLTISSEKQDEKEEKDKKFTRKEFNYSSFSRTFTLPDHVDKDQIAANYEDGVLNITLPRKEETTKTNSKLIAVQ